MGKALSNLGTPLDGTAEWVHESEIRAACAKAVGWGVDENTVRNVNYGYALIMSGFNPLSNDEQAMSMVKKFKLDIEPNFDGEEGDWSVSTWAADQNGRENRCTHESLNRAICECVAKMQQAKA